MSSYFIVGAETAEYLQQLMYEADLEAYKKSKRKKYGRYDTRGKSKSL